MLISFFALAMESNYQTGEIGKILYIPISAMLYGVIAAIVSYPFYKYFCKRVKGHRIKGVFIEEHDV